MTQTTTMKDSAFFRPLSRVFSIRLSGPDRSIVKSAAALAGVTESDFIRAAVAEKVDRLIDARSAARENEQNG